MMEDELTKVRLVPIVQKGVDHLVGVVAQLKNIEVIEVVREVLTGVVVEEL